MTTVGLAVPQAAAAAPCPAQSYGSAGPPASGQPVNDPLFPKQYGLTQIHAPAAWARGAKGAGTTIAVVDTGVDFGHPDLKAKLLPGADLVKFVASTGPTDPGITGPGCDGAQDENGHGTHVSGIAAAITNNGVGVAGTAPDAKILPVRVLDSNGNGEEQVVADGIRWAADHGANVINLSLGGNSVVDSTAGASQATGDAIAYAYGKGIVVVVAAGNDTFPACDAGTAVKNTVCVGATDDNGAPSAYSNFPSDSDGVVGVRAPGGQGSPLFCEYDGDIWSTIWPGAADDCKGTSGGVAGYDTLAGTSQATPFVSGLAADLMGKGLSAGQVLECLRTKSSNNGSYDPVFGYGIVDADAATAGCNSSTPSFSGGSGGGGGKGGGATHHVRVTVKRTTRKKLAKNGVLKVIVTSDRAAKVKLRAIVKSGKKSSTGATKTVRLKRAGTKKTVLKLSRKARSKLKKSKKAGVQVAFKAGKESGFATSGR